MNKLLLASLLLLPLSSFAKILDPQSGDAYACTDSVSGYEFELKIVDVGDESARVTVRDDGGSVAAIFEDAHVEMSADALVFSTFQNGRVADQIVFENYDLNSVYYTDGGDSRPMACQEL